jgi:hypothetical protein
MTYTERDPVLGDRQWSMSDCATCGGTGRGAWHVGCGDQSPGDCATCDGSGSVNVRARWVFRGIGPTTYGPWTADTDSM